MVFPHLAGEIPGFGNQIQRFSQWQQHHIPNPDGKDCMYDFQVFSIVKYFQLCMECNPNMIDSLFTARRCVMHSTPVAEIVRENRRLFLHKGAFHKFRGYAYAQLSKIKNKVNSSNPDRAKSVESFGYDVKFAYHLIRLLDECEQILVEHDLDLERNREQLKAIRRGEWTLEQVEGHFTAKERTLESIYAASSLRRSPDEKAIKDVLMTCLEAYWGSIDTMIKREPSVERILADVQEVLDKYKAFALTDEEGKS
jgi:predicted nucleotidyltransferase